MTETGGLDANALHIIAGKLMILVILEWIGFGMFMIFLGVLGVKLWGEYKRIQELRTRRVQPILNTVKALALTGKDLGLSVADHGKRILAIGKEAAESVELRAQTTTRLVKGTVPEAKRLPDEVAATAQNVRDALKTAENVAKTYRAVEGVRSLVQTVESIGAVIKSVRDVTRRDPTTQEATGVSGAGAQTTTV